MGNPVEKASAKPNLLTLLERILNSYRQLLKKLLAIVSVIALVLLLSLSIVFPIWLLASRSRIAFNISVLTAFSAVFLTYITLKLINNPKSILPSIFRKFKVFFFIILFVFLVYADIWLLQSGWRIAGTIASAITFLWFGYILQARRSDKVNNRR